MMPTISRMIELMGKGRLVVSNYADGKYKEELMSTYSYVIDKLMESLVNPPSKENKIYAVKWDGEWHKREGSSVIDMIRNLSSYLGYDSPLLVTAISACNDTNCIDMYNVFVLSHHVIEGIWEYGKHIYGDET